MVVSLPVFWRFRRSSSAQAFEQYRVPLRKWLMSARSRVPSGLRVPVVHALYAQSHLPSSHSATRRPGLSKQYQRPPALRTLGDKAIARRAALKRR
ncbi:MAG TPA: hypothetical protein VED59_05235, partial [Acidimicrobiales bacterium]|nr:hypothetical protein [Acidimicrobiales bacterium]